MFNLVGVVILNLYFECSFVSVIKRSAGYDVYDVKCVTYVRTWNKENLMQIGCYRHIMPLAAANQAKLN